MVGGSLPAAASTFLHDPGRPLSAPHTPREHSPRCWKKLSSCPPSSLACADPSAMNKSRQGWLVANTQAPSGLPAPLQSRPALLLLPHPRSHHSAFLTGLNHSLTLPCSLRPCPVTRVPHVSISSMKTRALTHRSPGA